MAELAGGSTINGYPLVGKRANDNYITKMSGNTLVNSNIYDDGTMVRVASFGANSFVVGDPVNLGSNGFAMSIAAPSNDGGLFPFGIIKNGTTNIFKITNTGAVLVYNQIQSSVATGIAPMTIASTTKVVNLNADLLDDMDTSTLAFANTIVARDTNANIVAKQFSSTIGQGGKPFYITSTTMCDNLNADMVDGYHFNQALLTTSSPTFAGLNTTEYNIIISKYSGYKSWVVHHPSSNALIFAPSATVNAVDWSWANQITFSDTGNIMAPSFTATTSTRGFYHKYTSDTVGITTFRNGSSSYQIRVNENGTNWYEDATRPTLALSFDVTDASPTSALSYRATGGANWIKTLELNHLTGDVILQNKFGTTSKVSTQTTGDLTFYVRTDGNDANSGLTAGTSGAFKTITKALSMIPKQVNHSVQIIVNPGVYNEVLAIQGFTGNGAINVNAASWAETPATHQVSGQIILSRNSCRITVTGFRTTYASSTNPIYITNSNEIFIEKCATETSTKHGIFVENAKVYAYDCLISNKTSAIYAHVNGEVFAQDCRGGSNSIGYQGAYGGRVHSSGIFTSSTKKLDSFDGGIVTDSVGAVNPWGDNTLSNRSYVSAMTSTSQTINNATWTRLSSAIGDGNEQHDNLSEFTGGRFTAKQEGVYLINIAIGVDYTPTNTLVTIRAYLNGSGNKIIATERSGAAGDFVVTGAMTMRLNAGDYIDFYLYQNSGNAITTSNSGFYSYLNITRIA